MKVVDGRCSGIKEGCVSQPQKIFGLGLEKRPLVPRPGLLILSLGHSLVPPNFTIKITPLHYNIKRTSPIWHDESACSSVIYIWIVPTVDWKFHLSLSPSGQFFISSHRVLRQNTSLHQQSQPRAITMPSGNSIYHAESLLLVRFSILQSSSKGISSYHLPRYPLNLTRCSQYAAQSINSRSFGSLLLDPFEYCAAFLSSQSSSPQGLGSKGNILDCPS